MTPVKQSKLYMEDGIHNGNCFAACLASLLDAPLWMIPPFEDMFGRGGGIYIDRCEEWLEKTYRLELVLTDGHKPNALPEYYIASGRSARGVMHAVIYRSGVLVHDPHFSDSGIESVDYTRHLQPVSLALDRPTDKEDALFRINTSVHQIQVIADEFGFDPCEWLNDQTAIGDSPAKLPGEQPMLEPIYMVPGDTSSPIVGHREVSA